MTPDGQGHQEVAGARQGVDAGQDEQAVEGRRTGRCPDAAVGSAGGVRGAGRGRSESALARPNAIVGISSPPSPRSIVRRRFRAFPRYEWSTRNRAVATCRANCENGTGIPRSRGPARRPSSRTGTLPRRAVLSEPLLRRDVEPRVPQRLPDAERACRTSLCERAFLPDDVDRQSWSGRASR